MTTRTRIRLYLARLLAATIVSVGAAQPAAAGMIGTHQLTELNARDVQVMRINTLLDREDVASQLIELGVDINDVRARIANLTSAELAALNGHMDELAAGSGVIGILGAVFLVLLILELVGVTDVFKKL